MSITAPASHLGSLEAILVMVVIGLGLLAGLILLALVASRLEKTIHNPETKHAGSKPSKLKATWKDLLERADHSLQGSLSEQIRVFEQVVQLRPEAWLGWFKLGRLHHHNHDLEQSLASLSEISRRQPELTLPYYERACLYQKMSRPAEAQQELNRLFQLKPDHEGGLRIRAELFLAEGNTQAALKTLQHLSDITQNPGQLMPLQAQLIDCLKDDPLKDPEMLAVRGDLLTSQGQTAAALENYYQALDQLKSTPEKRPESLENRVRATAQQHAKALLRQGEAKQAVAVLNTALVHLPEHSELLVTLAEIALQTGETQAFYPKLKAAASQSDNADLHYQLGLMHEKHKANQEALTAFQQCLALQPKHADAAYRTGTLFGMQNQLDLATQWLQQAVKHNPKLVDAWFNLAVAHEQRDFPKLAEDAYQRVLNLNPKHSEAANNLAILKKELELR